MRYKFRAYNENNEVMEYGVSVDNGRPVKEGYQLYNTENTVYHSQLMQFTGLTDVNGREIYEGDILDEYGYVVAFVDGTDSAALGMPMGWYEQRDDFESYRQLEVGDVKEVIGNIYQHKHLLKENE